MGIAWWRNAGWDEDLLALELGEFSAIDLDFDLEITGFSTAEIDGLIDGAAPEEPGDPHDDALPDLGIGPTRCQPGYIWALEPHG